MRILFTSLRSAGHFGPIEPFASGFARRGHDVLVAVHRAGVEMVRDHGLAATPLDSPPDELRNAAFERAHGLGFEEAAALVAREVFASADPRAAFPSLVAAIERFRPDLVLHETGEFAAVLAAEATDVPVGRIAINGAAAERWFAEVAAGPVDALRRELGLEPDPAGDRILTGPGLTLVPAALEAPDGAWELERFREPLPAAWPLPEWWDGDERPLVYLTLGSITGTTGFFPRVYREVIAGLATLDVRVLVTLGRGADPAQLGELPPSVHVERWIPQGEVMPHAAAMVCHGGGGTVRLGLAGGVPMVVLPLFADQPLNAAAVAATGAGLAVADAADVAAATRRVLRAPRYRATARRIADEIASLPLAGEALERVPAASPTARRRAAPRAVLTSA
jgi:UDP:flavonoid glycosyltransferase YjiC (YdhE family)